MQSYSQNLEISLALSGFNDNQTSLISSKFRPWEVHPKTQLLKVNDTCEHIIYITEGYGKIVANVEEGHHLRYLGVPNTYLSCLHSFIRKEPSTEAIHSITAMKGWTLNKDDFDYLIDDDNSIALILVGLQTRILSEIMIEKSKLLTMNASARYLFFCEKYPGLVNLIPIQDIASYLGIKRQSLSRIRRSLH